MAFLLSTFSKGLVLVDYYANPATFAQHCENKSRPKMHCNGKCQVMKKLTQEENKDKQNTNKRDNEDIICSRGRLPKLDIVSAALTVNNLVLDNKETTDRSRLCFQPPEA